MLAVLGAISILVLAGCGSERIQDSAKLKKAAPTQADMTALDQALAMVENGQYREAELRLESLASRFESLDNADLSAKALFWQGFCCEKDDRTEKAKDLYNRVLRAYPATPAARQASDRLKPLLGEPENT
jgi:TolA-binding protein